MASDRSRRTFALELEHKLSNSSRAYYIATRINTHTSSLLRDCGHDRLDSTKKKKSRIFDDKMHDGIGRSSAAPGIERRTPGHAHTQLIIDSHRIVFV